VYTKPVSGLYGKEVGYQRKCMKGEFFTEVLSGCWYISEDTDVSPEDSLEVVVTNEDFERVKGYTIDSDCPINSWDFQEGKHFIVFSY
jgi:hypothetical protein